jgi:heme A synthase
MKINTNLFYSLIAGLLIALVCLGFINICVKWPIPLIVNILVGSAFLLCLPVSYTREQKIIELFLNIICLVNISDLYLHMI